MRSERVSDFRSDTVTRPTPEMRSAMANAVVGDDVLGDDPTASELERAAAELVGKSSALFVPSGTMGNLVAGHVWCPRGTAVVLEAASHIYLAELGHLSNFTGAFPVPLPSEDGAVPLDALRSAVTDGGGYTMRTSAVMLETSHNFHGGTVLSPDYVREVAGFAHERGLAVHLDGARVFNAAAALGCDATELTREVDSVMFCLSKGLGAPIGSILAGDEGFVSRARRVRKAFGGGMRQVGVVAAAGLVALSLVPRLAEDNALAATLAERLSEIDGVSVSAPVTNILYLDLPMDADDYLARMAERGVLALSVTGRVRLVTHRDVGQDDVERLVEGTRAVLRGS